MAFFDHTLSIITTVLSMRKLDTTRLTAILRTAQVLHLFAFLNSLIPHASSVFGTITVLAEAVSDCARRFKEKRSDFLLITCVTCSLTNHEREAFDPNRQPNAPRLVELSHKKPRKMTLAELSTEEMIRGRDENITIGLSWVGLGDGRE